MRTDHLGRIASFPSDPSKEGHQFDGWFTTYGMKVTSRTAFTEDTEVCTKWTAIPSDGGIDVPVQPSDFQEDVEPQDKTQTIMICAAIVAVLAILCIVAVVHRNKANKP